MYVEQPPLPELERLVACVWWREVGAGESSVRVIPDGCVDVVHDAGGELFVAGPDTGPWDSWPVASVVGARLRVGAAGAALGLPAAELRDLRAPLVELWGDDGRRLEEALPAKPRRERLALLQAALARRRIAADPAIAASLAHLSNGQTKVGELAPTLGFSERQLRRRFLDAVGYGPKTLQRVLRLHAFAAWAAGRRGEDGLARAAAELGYADQAHLTRECRALAGTTPRALLSAPDPSDRRPAPGAARTPGSR